MSLTDDGESQGTHVILRQDALVESLRPSPANPPLNVRKLNGYLGRDTVPGYWRLYLSIDLTAYVRIAEADIIESQRSDSSGNDLDPSQVLVRANAEVDCVATTSLEQLGSILSDQYSATLPESTQANLAQTPDNPASFLAGDYTATLPESTQAALAHAANSTRQKVRPRRGPIDVPAYPATPGFPCSPQTTIESRSCFCSIFDKKM